MTNTTEFENQRVAGRRLSLQEGASDNRAPRSINKSFKKESKPKGHEAFLKALETSGAEIRIEFLDSGEAESLVGIVKHSDAYTVSLSCNGHTEVVFKHSIRKFSCTARNTEEE